MTQSTQLLDKSAPEQGATWEWPERPGQWRLPLLFLIVVVTYVGGSEIAFWLVRASGLQAVFYIPSGITVAFLLRLHLRHWWIVLLGAGLAEYVADVLNDFSTGESLGFAAANMAGPAVGATIIVITCGRLDLARRRHLLWYTLGGVIIGPGLGAALGAEADRVLAGDDFTITFAQSWLGNALAVILVGTAILVWGSSPDRRSLFSFWTGTLLVGSVGVTVGVFTLTDLPLIFSVLIGVVLAGALFGVRSVALMALAVALTMAVLLTLDPGDLIIGLTRSSAVVLIQLQLGLFTLSGLMIAAESHERDLAIKQAATSALEAEESDRARKDHHQLAVQVQRGLLPDRLYQPPGIQIAARYESGNEAFEVGGDWYDAMELSEGRIGVAVGDIVGHGVEAMTSMGRIRTALAALALHNDDPASLLSELDEFVGGPDGAGFATVFYAIVDKEQGNIRYTSAGHPPGLLLSSQGETIWLDEGQSEPLYGSPHATRRQGSAVMEPGATLILYSDGLIERRGEPLDIGLSRLERLASQLVDWRPEAICDELFSRLGVNVSREDDVVVLVMKLERDHLNLYQQTFPARPEELSRIRSSVRAWATDRNLPEETSDDLLLSIGEATANSVRHAYRDSEPGEVQVRITPLDHMLAVAVIDDGTWRVPSSPSESPGMGITIIRSLTREFHTEFTEQGTQVTFRVPITSTVDRA